MFARMAIFSTLLLFPGTASAEWQSQTAAATSNPAKGTAPQAASGVVRASLGQEVNPADAEVKYGSRPEVEGLIREGNKLMREGDILGARQSYLKAFASGDAAAALVMGRSYDPIYFAKLVKGNDGPDPAKAFEWYRRAKDAGAVQTATVRIEDLKQFMSK
jgi:hypothetical protein